MIQGYNQEEYTHFGAAAAQALDLDFIPLFQERYDLVIPKKFADNELLAPLSDF